VEISLHAFLTQILNSDERIDIHPGRLTLEETSTGAVIVMI